MPLVPRDVILIFDRHARPNKDKRHICVCPSKQYFLRINSRSHWQPHHFLSYRKNPNILEHDSYVELRGLVRHLAYEISRADYSGRMVEAQCHALLVSVRAAETLDDETKDFIEARLR